jgi:hypothetical protein
MRQEIVRKNQLFFDRWRPKTKPTSSASAKMSKGKNAREIPQFDPLIDAADQRIFQWQQFLGQKAAQTPAPMVTAGAPAKGFRCAANAGI